MVASLGGVPGHLEGPHQFESNNFLNPVIVQCDKEMGIIDVCRKVARERKSRTVLRFAPKTSHQSNGFVEAVHGHIQGLARCYQTQIETNTGTQLSASSPTIPSAVRYAGFVLSDSQCDLTAERHSSICSELRMFHLYACLVKNVLHIRGESELKFDVNEEAWPNGDLTVHSSYEGALIDGLPADKVKAGDEREIRQMKDLQLYSWVKETDVPHDKAVLPFGWARRMKANEVRSRCVLKDFATTVRDDVFAPTPSPL